MYVDPMMTSSSVPYLSRTFEIEENGARMLSDLLQNNRILYLVIIDQ